MRSSEAGGRGYTEEIAALRARVAELERVNRRLTKSRGAEEDLDKAWTEWERTFDAVRDSVMILDGDFRIVQANLATSRFSGKPLEEIIGQSCWQIIHGKDGPCTECPARVAVDTGNHQDAEFRMPEKDIWIEVSTDPIVDGQGKVDRVIHILRDITERKRLEQEVVSLANFPLQNPNPVLRIARDGTVIYGNRPSESLLKLWQCRQGERLSGKWRGIVSNALRTGKSQEAEAECGSQTYVLTFAPVQDGDLVNVYGLDITEHRKAEKNTRDAQEQLIEQQRHEKERVEAKLAKVRDELVRTTRLAAIGQVSASIAHDLRNPLGAVRNASYFLKRRLSGCEPKVSEHLEIIDQEITRADNIITNLLEMARPKAPRKQSLDFAEIVKDVFEGARGTRKVCCRISAVPDPFIVQADPNQLRQVISNILDNAIDAMKGQGDVLVQTSRDSEYDTLVFRDTGPGFDPQVRDKIFEPLVTTKASGTGLGLTICRQIVEKHGGTIDAEDCKGGGAVIRIRLQRQ
jgi:PAS domain S-box-containing protein